MNGTGVRRVVVGVDGSPGARAALEWALLEAADRGTELEVLSAFPVDIYWADPHLIDERRTAAVHADTQARVEAEVAAARQHPEVARHPDVAAVPVRTVVVAGPAAEHLVHQSQDAELLVVGSRGRGALRSTLVGSVALQCSAHARCPVIVVHPALVTENRVVVGIDRSPAAAAALRSAVDEAARLGAEVEAVAAYKPANFWSDLYAVVAPPVGQTGEQARRALEAVVAEVLGPDRESRPPVRVVVQEGAAADVLARQAEGAALLVVGSRGHSQLQGIVLGSVALASVLHAQCPVMVVHPRSGNGPERAEVAAAAAG